MVFGHLIGLAAENPELRVVNVSFWRFAELCAGTETNPRCAFPAPSHSAAEMIPRALLGIGKYLPHQLNRGVRVVGPPMLHKLMPWLSISPPPAQGWVLGSEDFLRRIRGRKRVLLAGWSLRDWNLFAKHQETIRDFLKPARRFCAIAGPFIADIRRRHRTLVGVLIRQGDYRMWEGGKFFLTTEQYGSCLQKLRERFGPDAALVVSSDEPLPDDAFKQSGFYWCTGRAGAAGHYMESFAELGLCDYIVSVPSTFSAWAAFFGRKPLLPIFSADDDLVQTPLLNENLLDAYRHPLFKSAVN